jgi:hypothetical protein
MFKGIHLKLLIGPTVPIPAPYHITNAITSIEITNTDSGRDGFQINLKMGREDNSPNSNSSSITSVGGNKLFLDFNLLNHPLLKPFNRIIIIVTINTLPKVLFDGLITNIQMTTSDTPRGGSNLIITGEDLSVMMDNKQVPETYENQSDYQIALKIINSYAKYGLVPLIIPPARSYTPTGNERVSCKAETDLKYLLRLARKNDYIFFVEPTDVPGVNIAYWGPKELKYRPKKPLNVNMGQDTNVSSLSFQYDALTPVSISGIIKIPFTNIEIPLKVGVSSRTSLASKSATDLNQGNTREIKFRLDGLNFSESFIEAQSIVNQSMDSVSSSGQLDVIRYGDILRARSTVFVRGAGLTNDGIYYVKSVTHSIKPGQFYTQNFELTREGLGTTLQKII